jgi:hypothetical protein
MTALLDVILPVFLVLGLGYGATRTGVFSADSVDALMRFAQTFAVPCLLFRSIATLDLSTALDTRLFAAFYVGAFACFGVGYLAARRLFDRPVTDSLAIGFACFFSNSLLLGLPITERAYGPGALAGNFAIISFHAPLLISFGIILMELARSRGQGLSIARVATTVVRAIFVQPLVIGIALGFVVNLLSLPLPRVVMAAVDMMAAAAIPAALFGLGGALVRYRPEGDMRTIAMVCAVSLVLHPAITYGLGRTALALDTDQLRSAVLTAAMAPGVNAYLFADLYGTARRVAASSVLIATALSIPTIWFWLNVLP